MAAILIWVDANTSSDAAFIQLRLSENFIKVCSVIHEISKMFKKSLIVEYFMTFILFWLICSFVVF